MKVFLVIIMNRRHQWYLIYEGQKCIRIFYIALFMQVQHLGFFDGSDGTESACNAKDPGLSPRSRRSPGEGNDNSLQYFCLENSMDRGCQWARDLTGCKELDMTERLTHKTSSHSESNSSELASQPWAVSGHALQHPIKNICDAAFLKGSTMASSDAPNANLDAYPQQAMITTSSLWPD